MFEDEESYQEVEYCLQEITDLISEGYELYEILASKGLEELEDEIREELQSLNEEE